MVGGPFLAVFSVASVYLSSQNWFCNSCHLMNSYYDSWKVSTHKDVSCVSCHIQPGTENFLWAKVNGMGQLVDDLLGRTSGKPSASVSDFSCMRSDCHNESELRKPVDPNLPYSFKHLKHLDQEYLGIDIHCTTCHSHIRGSNHFEVNANVCIACHLIGRPDPADPAQAPGAAREEMTLSSSRSAGAVRGPSAPSGPTTRPATKKPTRVCRKCHEPPTEAVDYRGLKIVHTEYLAYGAACESCHHRATARPRKVQDEHCFSCHDFGMERMTGTVELHHQHSGGKHKVECFSCHGLIRHGPSAQTMRLDRIDCRACHQGQHTIQQRAYKIAVGSASQPVASRPIGTGPATSQAPTSRPTSAPAVTPMFLAHVDCTGCHVRRRAVRAKPASGATVAVATPEACDRCHEPGLGRQMVPMWQRNTRDLYQAVSKMLESAPPAGDDPAGRRVAEARRLLELIRLDSSWGVHNPRYTQKLLQEARKNAAEAMALSAGRGGAK